MVKGATPLRIAYWTWRYPTEGSTVKTGATQKDYFMKNKYIISICTEV
jgi:hypothetical protein